MPVADFFRRLLNVPPKALTFERLLLRKPIYLYAGDLSTSVEKYPDYVGLSLDRSNQRHIQHDITKPCPLPDNCADRFQSQDVFEHIPFELLAGAVREIHRILKPGATFRLSVPDYRCDVLLARTQRDSEGRLLFDPGGGGNLVDGKVVDGGHLWFPTYEVVKELLESSPFKNIRFYHYYNEKGEGITNPIDYTLGYVKRTPDHDTRVQNPYRPMSIVVDCVK